MEIDYAVDHVRQALAAAPVRAFGVPHMVIDDVLPTALIDRINENWPDYDDGFSPEVKGNSILPVQYRNLRRMSDSRRRFWRAFNAKLWPSLVAAVSEALSAPLTEVFDNQYSRSLSLHWPLTLMQADPAYSGHDRHTHFYHCPHWAFTMLFYVDPEDIYSRGTGIHQLLPVDASDTSYRVDDLDWRVDVAMDSLNWIDGQKPDRQFRDRVVDYKANRLFVFMDGPLAFHSVPFDNPDRRPNPARARDDGRHARRRIVRSHVKVEKKAFFAKHSPSLAEPIDLNRYVRVMAPNYLLRPDDQRYRDQILRSFYRERLQAYARAAEASRRPVGTDHARPFGEGFYFPQKFTLEALRRDFLGRP
jgi:hypothetical protein